MIHALHGNFGLPSDWDGALPPGVPAKAWHLWEIRRHHPETRTLAGFATWFNNQIEALPPDPHRILAGYSLGGRLALHVLADRPALWHRALLISTHPGLTTEAERAARLVQDRIWQERCLHEPWDKVCADWNALPVFLGGQGVPELERLVPWRVEIASAFAGWSLGCQAGLAPWPPLLSLKGVWLAGGRDSKFCELTRKACDSWTNFNPRMVPDAGHRLLLDNSSTVCGAFEWVASGSIEGPDIAVRPSPLMDR